ncbi:MAG: autotransporter domain-containing protein [Thermodesulfobacteriota bacterium]
MMNEIKGKTRRMSRIGREDTLLSCIVLIVQLFAFLIFILAAPRSVNSAVFNVPAGDVTALINAINMANGNGEDDTINLAAGTYTLTAVNNNTDGPNGLPSITSNITINGAGDSTTIIERALGMNQPFFRIFHVAAAGNLTLDGLTITGGFAPTSIDSVFFSHAGGGIFLNNGGTVNITNSTISGNTADNDGGGIFNSGNMTITNSTINNNEAVESGGGIENADGTITITNSTISDNTAGVEGGGINNNVQEGTSIITVTNSTISGNTAVEGGGIENLDGTVNITNSTISDNMATHSDGGGIGNFVSGTINMNNVTITNNNASGGGSGLFTSNEPGSAVNISNTIIAQNTGSDCEGTFNSQGFNLIQTVPVNCSIVGDLTGNIIGQDPLLGPLANNGGHTQTHALLLGSPAIDAGNPDPPDGVPPRCETTDQRGITRPQGPRCDIGAFEAQGAVPPINPGFTGTFGGDSTFDRINPPFPQDDMATDPTTLELIVASGGASFNGTFNALWLPNVAITGTGSGNIISFSGSFEGACPGTISGTITLINPNQVFVDGDGDDCKSSYTFTGTLTRPGAGGNDGSSGGCSIALGSLSTPTSMLPYLLIPLFIVIRRGWKRFDKKSLISFYRRSKLAQKWLGNRWNLLFLVLLPATIWVLSLFIVSPVQAQTLIKECPNSPSAPALDALCSELKAIADMDGSLTPQQQGLLNICTELIESETPNCDAIDQTEPELISELYFDILRLQSNNLLKKLHIRLSAVRTGTASSVTLQGLAFNANDITFKDTRVADISPIIPFTVANQVSADEPSPFGKLGIFVNGSYNFGDRDQSTTQNGFDFNIFDVTGGVDYRFTNNFVLGVAFTYVRTDIDLDLSAGSLDTNAYYGSVYGSLYILDNFYIDGLANFGWIDYNSKRNINFTVDGTTVNQTANGDTNGFYYAFSANAGYDFHFEGLTFGPLGRFNYSQANIDGFQETIEGGGAGTGLALDVDDQDAKSLTTALGAQASYAISTGWGVFLPQVLFEWVHEFEDPGSTSATFVAGGGLGINPTINVQGEDPDRDTFNLGGGISAVFPHGISAFAYYESILGWEDVTSYYISGGIRFEL